MKPDKHLFVCVHDRAEHDPRGSCSMRGSRAVLSALRGLIFEKDLSGQVKATGTTCLGYCERGVTVVSYPDKVWYGEVSPEDVHDIVEEHIEDEEPVERLRIPEDQL